MKNFDFSDEHKSKDDNMVDEKDNNQYQEFKVLGDIDELIFPDDEPYYISQR